MQTIGQNNLYHIFVLPDFFSLSKTVANFRTSHLFVVYAEDYERGRFAAFGRLKKAKLYEDGKRYSNYQATEPNFRGRYVGKWFLDEEKYKVLKKKHQEEQAKVVVKVSKGNMQRDKLIKWLVEKEGYKEQEIGDVLGVSQPAISMVIGGKNADGSEDI
jgi:predicted XRE-type DNA-binding protein